MSKQQRDVLKQIVTTLDEYGIPYEITGGLAAQFYGANRPLYDIDIDIHKKDFLKVAELFREYMTEPPHRTTGDDTFDIYLMTLNIKGVHIDISQAEESYFIDKSGRKHRLDSTMADSQALDFDGVKVNVCNKEGLIAYKKIIARDTDLEDIWQIAKTR